METSHSPTRIIHINFTSRAHFARASYIQQKYNQFLNNFRYPPHLTAAAAALSISPYKPLPLIALLFFTSSSFSRSPSSPSPPSSSSPTILAYGNLSPRDVTGVSYGTFADEPTLRDRARAPVYIYGGERRLRYSTFRHMCRAAAECSTYICVRTYVYVVWPPVSLTSEVRARRRGFLGKIGRAAGLFCQGMQQRCWWSDAAAVGREGNGGEGVWGIFVCSHVVIGVSYIAMGMQWSIVIYFRTKYTEKRKFLH